ncbi:MAG: DUF427 domain-containing protein [Candidatus Promineifilaceae bacterium]
MKPQPITPSEGQESVWDYPRPPQIELTDKHIQIVFNGVVIADTHRAYRTLETSHPPSYYIPPEDIKTDYLQRANGGSLCEWKGQATYYTVAVKGKRAVKVAWTYHNPTGHFEAIRDYLAFYVCPMDSCYLNGEKVEPQPGHFYGGWITKDIVGPFKGEPGSWYW